MTKETRKYWREMSTDGILFLVRQDMDALYIIARSETKYIEYTIGTRALGKKVIPWWESMIISDALCEVEHPEQTPPLELLFQNPDLLADD